MSKLNEKVAVITGGASGLGLATARRFVAEGATVVIAGRRQDALDAAVESVGGAISAVRCDVTKLADLDHLREEVQARYGRVDVLFVNAAVSQLAPFMAVTEEAFDAVIATNVKGAFFTIQKLLPLMPDASSIVINASMTASKSAPGLSAYAASKAAVRSLARTLTAELKQRKIRVNAVSPGTFVTAMVEAAFLTPDDLAAFVAHRATTIPLGRVGKLEEVAAAVAFLASSESSYVTGIELTVDGGASQV